MKKSTLYLLWAVFYLICAGLGFIEEPVGMVRAMLFIASLLFFIPPAVLLHHGKAHGDDACVRRIHLLCAASLSAALLGIILSILTAIGSSELGTFMHILLGLISVPMFCSNYWVISLFLWAMLLLASKPQKHNKR